MATAAPRRAPRDRAHRRKRELRLLLRSLCRPDCHGGGSPRSSPGFPGREWAYGQRHPHRPQTTRASRREIAARSWR